MNHFLTSPSRQGHKGLNWAIGFISVIRLLQSGDWTRDDLMAETGVCSPTITKYLKLLHAPGNNCIYICDWKRKGTRGNWIAIYAWGWLEPDVPRPTPMTQAQYHQRWKQKQRLKGFYDGIREESQERSSDLSC